MRKIIQIFPESDNDWMYVLCDDGTIWQFVKRYKTPPHWELVEPFIPQGPLTDYITKDTEKVK